MRWLIVALCLLIASLARADTEPTLTFKVTGQAQELPSTALLRFSMLTEGESLSKAQQQLHKSEADVMGMLAEYGITRDQAQVERFSVTPLSPSGSSESALVTRAVGYRVQRDYSIPMPVSAEKLDKLIEIADAVLQKGARLSPTFGTQQDSYGRPKASILEFALTNRDELLQKALDDAVARARRLAEDAVKQIADAKVRLVRVYVTETRPPADYGYQTTIPTSTVWQPMQASVSLEATFRYD